MLQAGDLRSRVGFYTRSTVSASPDYGNTESEYPTEPEFECAANLKPRLGGEQVLASRLTGTNLVNITVRQSSRTRLVDTAWLVKDERTTIAYNIRSIIDPFEGAPDHGRWFELLCEKGVATGVLDEAAPALDFSIPANSGYLALLEDI